MDLRAGIGALALAAAWVAAPAWAQTYSKSQLQEMYAQYLSAEGFHPEVTNAGNMRFRREGRAYIIYVDEKDPAFFRVSMVLPYEDKSAEARAARMEGASYASEQTKVVKSYVGKDGNVTFSGEMFLASADSFKGAMPRTLRAIDYAHDKYRARMIELGKQP